jgi:uncharacterized OsmC-like protein
MTSTSFGVAAAAGTFRSGGDGALASLPHRWTRAGVEVHGDFTGAHVLHLAVAGCVLNDVYREAQALGVTLHGVRVRASGGFDDTWASTGITYSVDVDSPDDPSAVSALLARVDEVAEIPRALRAGAPVTRAHP